MVEGHARAQYVIEEDVAGKQQFRFATRDARVQLGKVFSSRRELFDDIVLLFARTGNRGLSDALQVPIAEEKYPVIKPIFGLSSFKANPDNLALLRRLSDTMYGEGQDGSIPAGYTYLSQFLAHELCRSEPLDPSHAKNYASFAIDLDSIYRDAPIDGLKLRLGSTSVYCAPFDLKRQADGTPEIGNTRNDANLAVAQLHCAIVSFHNAVADSGIFSTFDDVRRQVTLCFQRIVLEDWLPTITSAQLVNAILQGSRYTVAKQTTLCPAEAVLAAFRFGHSMARREYVKWNQTTGSAASISGLLRFTFKGGGLAEGRLPWDWPIDWRNFFSFAGSPPGALIVAKKIDTIIDDQLSRLDPALFTIQPDERSLAYRTLWFGAATGINDGWSVQGQLEAVVGAAEFPMQHSMLISGRPDLASLLGDGQILADHPPLWWFILREAELFGVNGGLAGVGARLVAETTIAAIEISSPNVLDGEPIHQSLPGGGVLPATMANLLRWGGQPLDWYVTGQSFHC